MTFLCLLLPEVGPIMHQHTCTSQLQCSTSFVSVHGDYSKAQGSEESASLSTFRQIWKSTTRTSSLWNPTRTFVRPVSKIEINCAVLYLVTRTHLWRFGWRILIPLRCAYTLQYLSSVVQEQGCSLSRFGLKSFEVVHNEYSCIPEDKHFTFHL